MHKIPVETDSPDGDVGTSPAIKFLIAYLAFWGVLLHLGWIGTGLLNLIMGFVK